MNTTNLNKLFWGLFAILVIVASITTYYAMEGIQMPLENIWISLAFAIAMIIIIITMLILFTSKLFAKKLQLNTEMWILSSLILIILITTWVAVLEGTGNWTGHLLMAATIFLSPTLVVVSDEAGIKRALNTNPSTRTMFSFFRGAALLLLFPPVWQGTIEWIGNLVASIPFTFFVLIALPTVPALLYPKIKILKQGIVLVITILANLTYVAYAALKGSVYLWDTKGSLV